MASASQDAHPSKAIYVKSLRGSARDATTKPASRTGRVREAYQRYSEVVTASGLAQNTKNTYLLHSGNFVKWLAGEFFPGERLKG